jgi:hypothetical protein
MAMGSIVPSLIAWGLAVGIVGMVWFSIPAIYIVHNYGPVAVKFVKVSAPCCHPKDIADRS